MSKGYLFLLAIILIQTIRYPSKNEDIRVGSVIQRVKKDKQSGLIGTQTVEPVSTTI